MLLHAAIEILVIHVHHILEERQQQRQIRRQPRQRIGGAQGVEGQLGDWALTTPPDSRAGRVRQMATRAISSDAPAHSTKGARWMPCTQLRITNRKHSSRYMEKSTYRKWLPKRMWSAVTLVGAEEDVEICAVDGQEQTQPLRSRRR